MPPGWELIADAARGKGLEISPSRPGRLSATMLRQVGGIEGLTPFMSPKIVDLFLSLSDRRGLGWFKARLGRIARELAADDAVAWTA